MDSLTSHIVMLQQTLDGLDFLRAQRGKIAGHMENLQRNLGNVSPLEGRSRESISRVHSEIICLEFLKEHMAEAYGQLATTLERVEAFESHFDGYEGMVQELKDYVYDTQAQLHAVERQIADVKRRMGAVPGVVSRVAGLA